MVKAIGNLTAVYSEGFAGGEQACLASILNPRPIAGSSTAEGSPAARAGQHCKLRWKVVPAVKNRDAFERRRMVQQHFIGRISVHESDPGYSNYTNLIRAGYDVRVFLNDERQECWVTADSDQNWIQCAAVGSNVSSDMRKGHVSIKISKLAK